MIVFVDGIDGSGKTTLITNLAATLTDHHRDVRVARPLWTFLTTISSPGEFANWVTGAPGSSVAEELLHAMTRRVECLRSSAGDGISLVDRGPKTIDSSARAHAGIRGASSPRIHRARERLIQATTALTLQRRCVSIELGAATHERVVERLELRQPMLPRYRVYLAAFSADMATSPAWPGLPTILMNAFAPESDNHHEAAATVKRLLSSADSRRQRIT